MRNVRAFPPAERSRMEAAVSVYVHAVVERQWPLMRAGKAEHSVTQRRIDGTHAVLQAYEPDDGPQRAFCRESITHLDDVVAQRRARLTQSHQELPLLLQVLVRRGAPGRGYPAGAYWASPWPSDQSAEAFSSTVTNTFRGSVPAYSSASSAIRRYRARFWSGVRPARMVITT